MTTHAGTPVHVADPAEIAILREVIEQHAPLERLAGSTGEFRSAELLAGRLAQAGAATRIEPATFLKGWAAVFAGLATIPVIASLIGPRCGRRPLAIAAGSAGLLIGEDIANGRRVVRRALGLRRATTNVIAELGPADAPRTLIVLAHHDAARTGWLFDQRAQQWLHRTFPDFVESIRTSIPQWWPAIGGPLAVAFGLLTRRFWIARAGGAVTALGGAALADIARSKVVPGANDNLSGVAVLVALAERWAKEPVDGVRVLLVSAGAEEELQGGIYGYLQEHAEGLDPATTRCLVVDTVGSPQLVMLEGEGPVTMHHYDEQFRDLVADAAQEAGVELERGLRSRFSTDAIVSSRAGIPTAALVSLAPWRAPSNYHLPTDTPDNIDYGTVAATTELAARVIEKLSEER